MADNKKPAGADVAKANQASKEKQLDHSTAPVDGTVITADPPEKIGRQADIERIKKSLPDTALTVVEEDVYEEFYSANSKRPLYRLRFPAGSVVLTKSYEAALDKDSTYIGRLPVSHGNVTEHVEGPGNMDTRGQDEIRAQVDNPEGKHPTGEDKSNK